jgi:1-acyl-sn-glycerol-3-phosphate acyltransferase
MLYPEKQAYHPTLGNAFTQFLGKKLLNLIGWKLEGEFPKDKKVVFCLAPHTSNWDFFIAIFAVLSLKLKANWMGKKQIFVWPVRSFLLKLGGIPVDRSAPGGLVQQVVDEFERTDSMIFALAPEGTRKRVKNWKSGFLRIAKQAEVPVYMVYFNFDKKVFGFHPERIDVDDIDASMEKIRQFYKNIPAKYPNKTN